MRIDQNGSDSQEYVYNASGQRVSVWDPQAGWEDQGQNYWGSIPVEYYQDGYAQFQHHDYLGTERVRTSYSGAVDGTFSSLPFGDGYTFTGNDNDAHHFAMLDRDAASDTDHAMFRQYANASGRWMSPDPYSGSYDINNPQSMNRYSYVLNLPLAYVDSLGLNCTETPTNNINGVDVSNCTVSGCDDGGGDDGSLADLSYDPSARPGYLWVPLHISGPCWGCTDRPAPNTGNSSPTWKQIKCEALAGLPVAIDAASLAADFAGPEGQAAKITVGFGLSLAATFTSAANGDAGGALWGAASFTRAPLEIATKSAGLTGLAQWIPGVGALGDGIAAIHDIRGVSGSYSACMAKQ